MWKKLKKLIDEAEKFLKEYDATTAGGAGGDQSRLHDLLLYMNRWLLYFQHERLIHLIVLVMTVFGELFTVALVLALPETVPYSLIAMYGVLILLAFYFRHYFLLENTVQHWYRLDDEILEEARKMQRETLQKP